MALPKCELYQGAVFAQIVRNPGFNSLKLFERTAEHGWGEYVVSDNHHEYRLFIKSTSQINKGRKGRNYSNFTFSAEDIDRGWMLEWETPIGPCGLMDLIGLDVVRDIEMVYFEESGDPSDRPPKLLLDMIENGKLGVKSGEGFYRYPNPAFKKLGWVKGGDEGN